MKIFYLILIAFFGLVATIVSLIGDAKTRSGVLPNQRTRKEKIQLFLRKPYVKIATAIITTFLIIIFNIKRDEIIDLDNKREQGEKDKQTTKTIDSLNKINRDEIIESNFKTTTGVYQELIKAGKTQQEAQQIIQATTERNLTAEIAKVKLGQLKPSSVLFTLTSDSLSFGSYEVNIIMSTIGDIKTVRFKFLIAYYNHGVLSKIKMPVTVINISKKVPAAIDNISIIRQVYDPEMFIVHIWGNYFDNQLNKTIEVNEYLNFNNKLKYAGPITEKDELTLNSFFNSTNVSVRAEIDVPSAIKKN